MLSRQVAPLLRKFCKVSAYFTIASQRGHALTVPIGIMASLNARTLSGRTTIVRCSPSDHRRRCPTRKTHGQRGAARLFEIHAATPLLRSASKADALVGLLRMKPRAHEPRRSAGSG